MTLRTRLVSDLIFPLQERLKQHTTLRVRREMEASQYWPLERLEAMRVERLRGLLAHAAQHVPYYRALFDRLGFKPDSVTGISDLQRLPFLTKVEIRAHTEAMKSDTAQGLARFNTGGSSGEPLVFFIGKQRVSHDVAAKWRATRWWGVDIGDPEIVLWGSPIELTSQDRLRHWRDARHLRQRQDAGSRAVPGWHGCRNGARTGEARKLLGAQAQGRDEGLDRRPDHAG